VGNDFFLLYSDQNQGHAGIGLMSLRVSQGESLGDFLLALARFTKKKTALLGLLCLISGND